MVWYYSTGTWFSARAFNTAVVVPSCVQYQNPVALTRSSHEVPHATSNQLQLSNDNQSVFTPVFRRETCRAAVGNRWN